LYLIFENKCINVEKYSIVRGVEGGPNILLWESLYFCELEDRATLRKPLLGELAMSPEEEIREREKKNALCSDQQSKSSESLFLISEHHFIPHSPTLANKSLK
jgi:hypothetical protein